MGQPSVRLWVKYTIFFVNVIFLLCGGIFIFVGVWGILSKSTEGIEAISEQIGLAVDPFYAFVIIGVIIFLIAAMGAIGSLRENTCMLKSYSGILMVLLLLEIALGVLVYVFEDKATTALERIMLHTIENYYDNVDNQYLVDLMQDNLQCCGATNPNEWQISEYFNCTSRALSRCSVPFSCCVPDPASDVPNFQCGYGVLDEAEADWDQLIFTIGCVESLKMIVISNAIIFGIIGGSLVIAQMCVIGVTRMMIGDVEDIKAGWRNHKGTWGK